MSVVPISTYGLSVNRCAAGRSTADCSQHAAREVGCSVHPHRGVGQLYHRRLEVSGVIVCAGLVGGLLEAVDQAVGGVEPSRRRANRAQVVLPRRAGRAGEDRRGDRGQLRKRVGRQCLRAKDQVGVGRLDGLQVRLAAGARAGHVVHHLAQIRGLAGGAVGQGGRNDAGLQAQRAQRVELVAGQHHDALRVGAHGGGARRVANLTIRRARVEGRGIGCTRFVGPALIAEHAGAGDLGGAGDDRLVAGRRRWASARSAPADDCHRNRGGDGDHGGQQAHARSADQHVADGNIRAARELVRPPTSDVAVYLRQFVGPMPTPGPPRDRIRNKTARMSRLDVWRTCW